MILRGGVGRFDDVGVLSWFNGVGAWLRLDWVLDKEHSPIFPTFFFVVFALAVQNLDDLV